MHATLTPIVVNGRSAPAAPSAKRTDKPATGSIRLQGRGDRWFVARIQSGKTTRCIDYTRSLGFPGRWVAVSAPIAKTGHAAEPGEAYVVNLDSETCDCIDGARRARIYPKGHELRLCKHAAALRSLIASAS